MRNCDDVVVMERGQMVERGARYQMIGIDASRAGAPRLVAVAGADSALRLVHLGAVDGQRRSR